MSIMPANTQGRTGKPIGDAQKEELVTLLVKAYREYPEELNSYFPELAAKVKELITPTSPPSEAESIGRSPLTEIERGFRQNSLLATLDKAGNGEVISKEEAVKALEDAAALGEHAWHSREEVLDIAIMTLDLPLVPEESVSVIFHEGRPVHHTYSLVRGMTLSLTWDGRLIKVDLDAKELKFRRKALSIIGIGSDTQSDVAENHDAYLAEIYDER